MPENTRLNHMQNKILGWHITEKLILLNLTTNTQVWSLQDSNGTHWIWFPQSDKTESGALLQQSRWV